MVSQLPSTLRQVFEEIAASRNIKPVLFNPNGRKVDRTDMSILGTVYSMEGIDSNYPVGLEGKNEKVYLAYLGGCNPEILNKNYEIIAAEDSQRRILVFPSKISVEERKLRDAVCAMRRVNMYTRGGSDDTDRVLKYVYALHGDIGYAAAQTFLDTILER
jgi:hypothetical protein